jgi:hypothetical protein
MNLSVLATLTGVVSAVSVLISLLLLKRQIRQSEKNQRALIQQGRAGRSADIVMRLMSTDYRHVAVDDAAVFGNLFGLA